MGLFCLFISLKVNIDGSVSIHNSVYFTLSRTGTGSKNEHKSKIDNVFGLTNIVKNIYPIANIPTRKLFKVRVTRNMTRT